MGRSSITQRIIENQEWRWILITGSTLLIVLSLPYFWAYASAVPDRVFMGVLGDPLDISYEAKMAQGYSGSILFQLPYTPEPHRGVFLYTFYILLGHLSRLLSLPTILVFHAVRLIGGMFMFITIYRFVADWTDSVDQRRITWALAVLGAGFGWVALTFGYVSPDLLLMPEAFPFQAVFATAHYPWAIAMMAAAAHLLVAGALVRPLPWVDTSIATLALGSATVVLASIAPYALLPLLAGYGVLILWLWIENKEFPRSAAVWGGTAAIFGLPLALYALWAVSEQNPVFHAWLQQAPAVSPPVWDYLIAFAPLLVLTIIALWGSRRQLYAGDGFLIGWVLATALLLYVPLGIQRRFTLGLIVPLAIYSARGVWRVLGDEVRPRRRFIAVLFTFLTFVPTTIAAITLPLIGTRGGDLEPYYITQNEAEALVWLRDNASRDDVILASPSLSLFVPVYGPRVVYGHPYETVNAAERRRAVVAYYQGEDCSVIQNENVDYVIIGSRERRLLTSDEGCPPDGALVFESNAGEVAIYEVRNQ